MNAHLPDFLFPASVFLSFFNGLKDFGKLFSKVDRNDCRREVEERIEAQALRRQFGYDDVESVVELMTDTLCSTRPTLRIGGEEILAEQVNGRFLYLDYGHLEYVFDCLRRNTTQIRNIRAYLLTALYNAPVTMSPYYQAAVQHDFGP